MVEAIFTETTTSLILAGLTQWDYGQKLHIKGLELPEVAQIHFCNTTQKEAIVMPLTKHDDVWICEIPNVLLEYNYDIKAWIFLTSEEQGETIKTIYLKVEKRAKPQDFISENPDATDILSDVVNKINQNIKDNAEFKEDITEQQTNFENGLNESEALRVEAEKERVQAEEIRQEAENVRNDNEYTRIEAEKNRKQAETKRVEAETSRVNAENERKDAESSRNEAETERDNAETERNEWWYNAKQENEKLLEEIKKIKEDLENIACPYAIGDLYITLNETIPSERWQGTTWERQEGYVPVGYKENDDDFGTLGKTGGTKAVTLSVDQIPAHTHSASTGSAGSHSHTASTGSAGTHNHSASTNSTGAHTHSVSGTAASAGGHTHVLNNRSNAPTGAYYNAPPTSGNGGTASSSDAVLNGAGTHNHSVSGTASSAGGHSHTVTVNNGGAHSHSVTVNENGAHTHSVSVDNTGGGKAHTNLQPYKVFNMWLRTA